MMTQFIKLGKLLGNQIFENITHYKRIIYNTDVMLQTTCLIYNTIIVDSYAFLFNCTMVDRVSDGMAFFGFSSWFSFTLADSV